MSSLMLTVDGVPATEIAPHSPPTWETQADGGSWLASWAFALSSKSQHRALYPGAIVHITAGASSLWTGRLNDPDRSTWECTASGLSAHAHQLTALDETGAVTRNLGEAIARCQAAGWAATNPLGLDATASGDSGDPQSLGSLLDQYCSEVGQRWGVDGAGRLYIQGDPSAPTLLLMPDAGAIGNTDEGSPSHMVGRFINVGGTYSTTRRPDTGVVTSEETVDITDRGELTLAEANTILDGMLTRRGPGWTNGITVTRDQLGIRRSVTPMFLQAHREVLQMHGAPAAFLSLSTRLTTPVGKTRFDSANPDEIYLEPVNTAPRDVRSVTAA